VSPADASKVLMHIMLQRIVLTAWALQVPAVDAQSCAADLHRALSRNDFHQASNLIRLAPHPGVFEMVNKQQQNALHLAGKLS